MLTDYATIITGDCAPDGTVTLAAGDNKACTIINTKKAKLTVNKVTDPTSDPGLFNLQIDGDTAGYGSGRQGNGGTTGAVALDVISQPDGNAAFGAGYAHGAVVYGPADRLRHRDRRPQPDDDDDGDPVHLQREQRQRDAGKRRVASTLRRISLTDASGDGPAFGFSPIVLTTPFAVTAGQPVLVRHRRRQPLGHRLPILCRRDEARRLRGRRWQLDLAFQVIFTHTVSETAGDGDQPLRLHRGHQRSLRRGRHGLAGSGRQQDLHDHEHPEEPLDRAEDDEPLGRSAELLDPGQRHRHDHRRRRAEARPTRRTRTTK